jgi:hypothetical protein
MANPLQQFFRQPKIYIKLPSGGAYNVPGTVQGDITKIPVFGMTGMDEIILKTPDALLAGESTVKVIESCVPAITDAWELCNLDTTLIIAAIRIATYGSTMAIKHTCPHCQNENDYDIDLTKVIEHYNQCTYENKIVLDNLVIRMHPLTYRQSTEYSLKNFRLQQQLNQARNLEDENQQQEVYNRLFKELGELQNDIFQSSVEAVETGKEVVTQQTYIKEFLANCDKVVFDEIRRRNEINRDRWALPSFTVQCSNTECSAENTVYIELDQANFFVKA